MKKILLLLLSGWLMWLTARAGTPNQAAVVIQHGDGSTVAKCVAFTEPDLSGLELLQRSGLTVTMEVVGLGQTVCLIDQEGCAYPTEPCFCRCQAGATSCNYWTYWHLLNGQWRFAAGGAGSYRVQAGMVDGWQWGGGQAALPKTSFAQICGSATASLTYLPYLRGDGQ